MTSMAVAGKPHAVFVPFPLQSHIKALLKLAKLLHHRGFYITFVNTEFNHQRFLRSSGPGSLDGLPDFRFETIPDGLPPSNPDANQDTIALCRSIGTSFSGPFGELVSKINDTKSNVPPITCIFSDGVMPFTAEAAQQLGVPLVKFFTVSATLVMTFKPFQVLNEKGIFPLKDESQLTNGYLDTFIDCIPGLKGVRLRDLPAGFRTADPNDSMFNFLLDVARRSHESSAIILHTFNALEQEVLDALSCMYPRVYSIGPLQLHLNRLREDPLKATGYNLWKEDIECLQWMDLKQPNSVIYVNFGSTTVMTHQQLVEFGMGLASSKHPFLWIIRPDLVYGQTAVLPPEFVAAAEERGFIASWCPQEEVLNHPSVAGFLTHSGWNSTIESLAAGVPMLCWPFSGDQPTNCWCACNQWGVGLEIHPDVKRDQVEKLVKELIEGEKGKMMKDKAMQWKRLAEEATDPNGSSSINLDNLVNEVLSS